MRRVFQITDGDHDSPTGPIPLGMAVVSDPDKPYMPVVIETIQIFPQYRGNGHGTALLQILINHAQNENKNLIVPTETLDNDYPGAFTWLSDRGFVYKPALKALVKHWYDRDKVTSNADQHRVSAGNH